jgi:hypothetical protein
MTSSLTGAPPAARFLPQRWYYGWYIALACAALMFVGVGVGYYGLPVFLKPLKDDHGWTTTQVSFASTIYFCISGLTAALVGPYVDRRGPKTLMLAGTLINGVSAAFIGLVNELWQLYAVYFVFAVAFGMSSAIAVNAIMTRWFVRRRALAMSISSTGVSSAAWSSRPSRPSSSTSAGWSSRPPSSGRSSSSSGCRSCSWWSHSRRRRWASCPTVMPASRLRRPRHDGSADAPVVPVGSDAHDRLRGIFVAFLLVLIAQTGYIVHQVSFLEDRLGSRARRRSRSASPPSVASSRGWSSASSRTASTSGC